MSQIAELEVRLSRLESRYRRVQLLSVVSSSLLAGACLTAAFAPVSDELRARRFVLVDDQGKESGVLETSEGMSMLRLTGSDGDASLVLGAGVAHAGRSVAGCSDDDELGLFLLSSKGAAAVSVEERGSVVELESGVPGANRAPGPSFAIVNLEARRDGVRIFGECGELGPSAPEHRAVGFDLGASTHGASLNLRTHPHFVLLEDEPVMRPYVPPEIQLTAVDGAGALQIHSGNDVRFHAP